MDLNLLPALAGLTALLVAATGGGTAAKRPAPPRAASVTMEGVRYTAVHERVPAERPRLFRASLQALDEKTSQPLWKTQLFEITYRPELERDVQEVFVKRLYTEKAGVLALTEGEKHYLVDPRTHKARELPAIRGGFSNPKTGEGPRILDARGGEEPGWCEVHKRPLEEDAVRIAYGLIRFTPEDREARERFPHAHEVHYGGCLVGPWSWALVHYCPECRSGAATLLQDPRKARNAAPTATRPTPNA